MKKMLDLLARRLGLLAVLSAVLACAFPGRGWGQSGGYYPPQSCPIRNDDRGHTNGIRFGVIADRTWRSARLGGVEVLRVLGGPATRMVARDGSLHSLVSSRHVILRINGREVRTNHELVAAVYRSPSRMYVQIYDRFYGQIVNYVAMLDGIDQQADTYDPVTEQNGYSQGLAAEPVEPVDGDTASYAPWVDPQQETPPVPDAPSPTYVAPAIPMHAPAVPPAPPAPAYHSTAPSM